MIKEIKMRISTPPFFLDSERDFLRDVYLRGFDVVCLQKTTNRILGEKQGFPNPSNVELFNLLRGYKKYFCSIFELRDNQKKIEFDVGVTILVSQKNRVLKTREQLKGETLFLIVEVENIETGARKIIEESLSVLSLK